MKDFTTGPDEPREEEPSRPDQGNGPIQNQRKNRTPFSRLDESELNLILSYLPGTAKQARRFCVALSGGEQPTSFCNKEVLAVNLSDISSKYNPRIAASGFQFACRQPERQILNRLGEPSGQVYWGLRRIPATSTLLGGAQ